MTILESNKVDLFDLVITWQVYDTDTWTDVAQTSNKVYVTWDVPVPENPGDFNIPGQEPDPTAGEVMVTEAEYMFRLWRGQEQRTAGMLLYSCSRQRRYGYPASEDTSLRAICRLLCLFQGK